MATLARTRPTLTLRRAGALMAATLVAYVGLVHEVVGATLYPDGPERFGGPLGWHAAGLAGIVAGLALAAGVLRLFPVPIKALSALVGLVGAAAFIGEVALHGGFHFFAFTVVAASGLLIAIEGRSGHE